MYIAVTFWYSLQEFHISLKTLVTSHDHPKKRQRKWMENRLEGLNEVFLQINYYRGLTSRRLELRASQN